MLYPKRRIQVKGGHPGLGSLILSLQPIPPIPELYPVLPHARQLQDLPFPIWRMVNERLKAFRRDNIDLRQNGVVCNLAEEGYENQEMVFVYLLQVVYRPAGSTSKSFDVDGDNAPLFPHHHYVHGFLVAEGEAGVTPKPVEHGEDVELGS